MNQLNNDFATASFETLMSQATKTAAEYLRDAITAIDNELGAGYAKANPELIGAFMRTAASDFATAVMSKSIGHAVPQLGYGLEAIASQIAAHN